MDNIFFIFKDGTLKLDVMYKRIIVRSFILNDKYEYAQALIEIQRACENSIKRHFNNFIESNGI